MSHIDGAKVLRNIEIDVAFSIETEKKFEDLTKDELLAALLQRVVSLMENFEPDAFGFVDEYQFQIVYRNFYFHCNQFWYDTWSCMCNDRCPKCNAEIEPYYSEELKEVIDE